MHQYSFFFFCIKYFNFRFPWHQWACSYKIYTQHVSLIKVMTWLIKRNRLNKMRFCKRANVLHNPFGNARQQGPNQVSVRCKSSNKGTEHDTSPHIQSPFPILQCKEWHRLEKLWLHSVAVAPETSYGIAVGNSTLTTMHIQTQSKITKTQAHKFKQTSLPCVAGSASYSEHLALSF